MVRLSVKLTLETKEWKNWFLTNTTGRFFIVIKIFLFFNISNLLKRKTENVLIPYCGYL